ncbi:MAG: PstS family phosphate ABC transporter substrate-binding protein [Aequorivita sp.]|nr:PstS family phosphate ABC transporter substrate-binding protein [Aequorivita sp.]
MKKLFGLAFLAVASIGCNNLENDKSISIDGSSTVFPVTAAVAEKYRKVEPKIHVTIGVSGTGGGFQKFTRGSTNLSNASRSISESEIALAKNNKIEYVELEVAYDGLAVVVHPDNTWADSITVEDLKRIWEPAAQGKITHWNQINPAWPNEEMHLFGPGVASGTFDYFTEAVVGESGASRGDFTASEDDNVLVQGVSGDKYGLGFFGIAYFEANKDKLKLVGVDSGNGPVKPTTETIKNGTYSPLSRPLFLYVNSSSLENMEVVNFVKYYLQNVGGIAKDVGYVALTEEEYAREIKKFNSFVEKHTPSGVESNKAANE